MRAGGARRRASAPRRRKIRMILAAMLWYLLNLLFPLLLTDACGYDDDDDDDDAYPLAYQFYQDDASLLAPNASLLRVVSLVELYERARRDDRWYYKYQLSDLPTRRGERLMFIAAGCKGLRTRISPQTGSRRLSLKRYLSVFARRTDHVVVVKSAGSPAHRDQLSRMFSPTVTAEPCSVPPPHPGLQRPTTPCSATSARSPKARTRPITASHTPPPRAPRAPHTLACR
jgi:hypothetical protein